MTITQAKLVKDVLTGLTASVQLTFTNGQIICSTLDPSNTDYQAFLKYQAEGGKVYGADEEVPTPADEETQ